MKKITDKEEALKAVEQDGMKLKECSDELRNDKDVVITALMNRERAMEFVPEELKYDEEVLRRALANSVTPRYELGIALTFLPDELRNSEKVILMSIELFAYSFKYAPDKFKNDEDFLVEAAVVNINVLNYVDKKFKNDANFIQKVIDNFDHYRLAYRKQFARSLGENITDNKEMMKQIIEKADFNNFQYASERLKKDRDFIIELLPKAPGIYKFLYAFSDDKEITLQAVKADGMNLRLAYWDLKEDKEVVLEAVKNNPHSIQFAGESLQDDEELWSYVTKNRSYYFDMIDHQTGFRYDIPMLDTMDPDYFAKYVRFMQIKERSPDTFDKIQRWD